MRHTVAARHTPRRIEIQDQHLSSVLGKNRSFPIRRFPTHVCECSRSAGWRHRIGRPGRWTRDDGRVGVNARRIVAIARSQRHQTAKKNYNSFQRSLRPSAISALKMLLNAEDRRGPQRAQRRHFRTLYLHRARLPSVHFVPGEAVHRGRDTRLRPTCPDRRAGTVPNRRDEQDCFSNRLVYRRLGIS